MSKVIEIASKEIGYSEDPPNSNKTKYGKWFGLQGVAWCGIFASWCYDQAGQPIKGVGFLNGFAGCQTAVATLTKKDKIVTDPQPGDLVFFDWNSDGRYDHVGLFENWIDKETFTTIEGNTSIGNDSNGGTVMRRTRSMKKGKVLFARL